MKFDLKKLLSNKKVIILGIIGIIIVTGLIIWLCLNNSDKNVSQKEKLEESISVLAKEFYEVKYYPGLSDNKGKKMDDDAKKKHLAKYFKDEGITVTLATLARMDPTKREEVLNEFKNEKTGKSCDVNRTSVIIYPKEPYGIKDYTFKIMLDCGF